MMVTHTECIEPTLNRTTQNSRGFVRQIATQLLRLLCCVLFIISLSMPSNLAAAETVRAEIKKSSAWTGEAVPLIITLYSPGPFSGTAAFDLPDKPRTAFVNGGSPVVSSEEVDGESYFTQRHELTIYTQLTGEVLIPSFRVRFAGKKTFTSDPEPMEGMTPDLRFESKRPPGTESMGLVVCATDMEVQQTWNPESIVNINAGDVVERTIKRTAAGTTAMMLPVIPADAPDGTQVYAGTPEVEDQQDRGDLKAVRIDTMKYQFQRAGTFDLPELDFDWWDPQQKKLQRHSLPGRTVTVSAPSEAGVLPTESNSGTSWFGVFAIVSLVLLVGLAWCFRKPIRALIEKSQAHHNRPEAIAIRKLRAACQSNDASSAYSALMSWATLTRSRFERDDVDSCFDSAVFRGLREQWQVLSRHLFAAERETTVWQGEPLWTAFSRLSRRQKRGTGHPPRAVLAQLNPGAPTLSNQR